MTGPRRNEIRRHPEILGTLPRLACGYSEVGRQKLPSMVRESESSFASLPALASSKNRFTVRVGERYRALGRLDSSTLIWVWIGSHAEYDRLVRSI